MGEEHRTYHWGDQPANQRLTVAQAAEVLGITEGAVRSRIKRGMLPTAKEGGTVFVLLGGGTSQANQAPNTGAPAGQSPELLEALRDQIRDLREQLQSERQAHAEARRLLLSALEKIPPAIEPPGERSEPRESPVSPGPTETPAEAARSAQEPPDASGMHMPEAGGGPLPRDQQAPSGRPWWRRIFEGL